MNRNKTIIFLASLIIATLILVALYMLFDGINSRNKIITEKDSSVNVVEKNEKTQEDGDKLVVDDDEKIKEKEAKEKKYKEDRRNMIIANIKESSTEYTKTTTEIYKVFSECFKMEDENRKDTCLILFAENEINLEICKSLSGDKKIECTDRVKLADAELKNDINMCSGLETIKYKTSCIYNIVSASDMSMSDCEPLTGDDRETCQMNSIMINKISLESCKKIDSEKVRTICLDSRYNEVN